MNLKKQLLLTLFALLIGNILWAVTPIVPIKEMSPTKKEQRFPKLMERILFQKIATPNSHVGKRLLKKRKALAERYAAEEELRDPVKKWFWNAFFLGVGGFLLVIIGAIISVKGQDKGDENLENTGFYIVVAETIAIMVGFFFLAIWVFKWMGF